jgi:protein phosphatase
VVALRAGSATDVGLVRSNNQDAFLAADPLYAVADGMGGAAAGEVASAIAVEALNNGFSHTGPPTSELLIDAARAANRAVWDEAEAHPVMRGMGTTLVAIALVEGPQLAIINIGDSRLYQFHDGELRQVTFDHNLVAEMVAEGRITPAEAEVHPRRNIMTRALGVEPDVPIDLFVEEPVAGDRYLLCSDGLPRELSDDLIASFLRRFADPGDAARELVDAAREKGGNDNITVVVVEVVDGREAEAPAGRAKAAAAVGGAAGDDPTLVDGLAPPGPEADGGEADGGAAEDEEPGDRSGAGRRPGRRFKPRFWRRRPIDEDQAPPPRPTRSAFTLRVVAFVLLFIVIIGGAIAGIVWYARSAYYVGMRGNNIVIYQGRPGGVLGLNPTLKETTQYTADQVLPSALPALKSGQQESSVASARQYVQNLVTAAAAAEAAGAPPTTPAPPVSSTTTGGRP